MSNLRACFSNNRVDPIRSLISSSDARRRRISMLISCLSMAATYVRLRAMRYDMKGANVYTARRGGGKGRPASSPDLTLAFTFRGGFTADYCLLIGSGKWRFRSVRFVLSAVNMSR